MRTALLESYVRRETLFASSNMLREAIDMSVEEPDHAHWYMIGNTAGDVTIGNTAKDLIAPNAAEVRRMAFLLYYQSPFVRGIIRTMRKFIFGRGVTVELEETNKSKKKQAEEYLEEWRDLNHWDLIQKETSDRTFRDGECFWHNRWIGKKKVPRLEFVEPDDVRSDEKNASHGIELYINDPTLVKRYHIKKAMGDTDGSYIDGADMQHIKINVDANQKRGRSLFEPVFRYIKWHEDWLQSRIVLNKVRSAVALVRHVEGTQVQGQLIRKPTENKDVVVDGQRRRRGSVKAFKSGSILTAGPGVKYEMLSANLGASDAAQDGRNILLSIAVGIGFPEMFLTGNFENANYSSSLTAQNPFVREFEDWQDFFDYHIKAETKRVLEMGIEAGLVAKGTSLKSTNKFPPLTYEDFAALSVALGQLFLNEIISAHTYATKMGFDYEEEKELRDQEAADAADSDFGDFGGGGGGEDEEDDEIKAGKENLLQGEDVERGDLQEAARGPNTLLKVALGHQKRNEQHQAKLRARIAAGSHHTKTMLLKQGRHARRAVRISKLARKVGVPVPAAGTTNVRAQTRHSIKGKVFNVRAHVRKLPVGKNELLNSDVLDARPIKFKGNLNGTYLLKMRDSKSDEFKSVFKPTNEEDVFIKKLLGSGTLHMREVAAAEVGEVLGMDKFLPSVVEHTVAHSGIKKGGGLGALMSYINGGMKNAAKFTGKYGQYVDRVFGRLDEIEVGRIAAFDYVIGNMDRHANNWKLDPNNSRIGLIDHGMTFPDRLWTNMRSNFGARAQQEGLSISKSIGNSFDGKWPAIKRILEKNNLSTSAILGAKERYDEVIGAKNANLNFADLAHYVSN